MEHFLSIALRSRHSALLWIICGFFTLSLSKAQATPYQYYILGDSMVKTGLGTALKKKLAQTSPGSIRIFGKSSTGFSRPELFDWQQSVISELKSAAKKDQVTVFVMMGTNDCQDIPTPSGSARYWSQEWKKIYKERLLNFGQTLCQGASQVYWLGLPPMRPKKFNDKITKLNQFTEDSLKQATCIQYIATDKILGSPSGEYLKTLRHQDKIHSIRESDGIHISYDGAKILADRIFDEYFKKPSIN